MTGLQELKDEELGLVAQLAGKRMELAMAQGEKAVAHHYKNKMHEAIQAHRAFRIAVSEASGSCYFLAAAEADLVAMLGGSNAN